MDAWCPCGARGCLEAEASGPSIEAATGAPAAEAGVAVRERTGTLVGRAIASVANLVDLDLALVGGSVALGFGAPFFDAAQRELSARARLAFSRPAASPRSVSGSSRRSSAPARWHSVRGIRWGPRRRRRPRALRDERSPPRRRRSSRARGGDARRIRARRPAAPRTWCAAMGALRRFAPRGWWRRPPFLPVPDERYWEFRMETAYGDQGASPDGDDVSTAIVWSRRARARRR